MKFRFLKSAAFLFVLIVFCMVLPLKACAKNTTNWSWKNIEPLPIKLSESQADVGAKSAVVYDWETGSVLYSKNPEFTQPIASITKLMTSVILLENFKKNDAISVSYRAASTIGSKMHLLAGEKIQLTDIVKGLMIASANDAALATEDNYGKEKIVKLMNAKTKELGLEKTKYSDAVGLNQENTSNAKDLYLLSYYALLKPEIKTAVMTKEETITSLSGQQHLINTTNRLLKQNDDIFGIKTGFTDEAGNCLIAGAQQNGHKIVSIILGAPNYDRRFSDSRKLLDWTFENYKW